jgi:tetratricopeptide (TPR) repeat protein
LADYRPVRRLGMGGFGEVWLAEQLRPVTRQIALKVLKPGMDSRQLLARFESERQALALMDHPYVARVFDAGTTEDGRPYFAMEYVDGLSVTRYCDRHKLKTGERLELFVEICQAIQHAHQKGIIHRDIKPSNVMVAEQDGKRIPKIIDFGIAKATEQPLTDDDFLTHVGMIVGTPSYMSPEQADENRLDIDTRTDVYSLGVLLYELLVGALPFETTDLRRAGADEIRRRIREEDPPRPSTRIGSLGEVTTTTAANRRTDPPSLARHLRGDLDWIVMKALEKERERRYGSPNELADDIGRHLEDQPVVAGPPDASYRVKKFVQRHRIMVAAASLVLAALVVGLGLAVWGLARATRAEAAARQDEAAARRVADFMVQLFEAPDPTLAQGKDVSARDVLDRGVERIETGLDDQPRTRAMLLETMGRVYRVMGLYDEASPLLEAAVEIRGTEESAELAAALSELATTRAWQGNYEASEELARRAIAIRESLLGTDHPDVAESLNVLGNALQNTGQLEEAEAVHRRALTLREAAEGLDRIAIGQSAHNLAIVRFALNDYDEAERLYKRAAAIEEEVHGPDNHNFASSLHTLAILYESQARYDEAVEYEQRALEIRQKVLGEDHPHVSFSLTTLANIYRAMDRAGDAEPLLRRAIAIGDHSWSPMYPEVRWMRRSLAASLSEQGRHAEAEEVLRWLLARSEAEDDEGILPPTLNALGKLLAATGRPARAEEAYRRSLAIDERVEGEDSPYLATALGGLAGLTCDLGRTDDGTALYARAVGVLEGAVAPDDPDRVALLNDYAACLESAGRSADARKLLALPR